MTDPTWSATDGQAADRVEFHLMVTALAGRTGRHLREHHATESTDDRRENARLHMEAHGMPANARAVGIGRLFPRPAASRPGQGVGGGRPRKTTDEEQVR